MPPGSFGSSIADMCRDESLLDNFVRAVFTCRRTRAGRRGAHDANLWVTVGAHDDFGFGRRKSRH